MSTKIPIALVRRYLADQCSPDEINQVNDWFNSFQRYPDSLAELSPDIQKAVEKKIFEKIAKQISEAESFPVTGQIQPLSKRRLPFRIERLSARTISIAAMLLVVSGLSFYLIQDKPVTPPAQAARINKMKDVPPGGNHAVLTLGNGKAIVLDAAGNGLIAKQGNSTIRKTGSGQLVYVANGPVPDTYQPDLHNTISTPVGGQYHVILPDGTQAWLNSGSSLTFPAHFTGRERKVEMTGEVYFEVAKNAHMPFKVKSKQTEVEVLGTHFDIMAYDDERTQKTTLLEGSVKISTGKAVNTLSPGEQAVIVQDGSLSLRKGVDLDNVIAWKNGFFDFKNTDLSTIMRQAARWYGISVNFKGETATMAFTGRIPREVNLSELLKMLQYTGLKYRLEGKNLTFEP